MDTKPAPLFDDDGHVIALAYFDSDVIRITNIPRDNCPIDYEHTVPAAYADWIAAIRDEHKHRYYPTDLERDAAPDTRTD